MTPARYGAMVDRCLYELGALVGVPDEVACMLAAQQVVLDQRDRAVKAGDARLAGWLRAAADHLALARLAFDLADTEKAS